MKYLVTGGCGFIGSALVRRLLKSSKNSVLNIDKLTYAHNPKAVEDFAKYKNYELVQRDISDYKSVSDCFFRYEPDVIIHLAAESHVDNSIEDSSQFIKTNILGTYNLLEIFKEYYFKISNKQQEKILFHHVSTDEVYGDLKPDEEKFSESSSYKPSSPYSASKASSDHLVRAWYRTFKIPVTISNCSNNYGPFQHKEKLIPKIIDSCLNNKKIPIYGSGSQVRDWLFVEDHVDAILEIIKSRMLGETFLIGGNAEKRNIDITLQICKIMDNLCPSEIKYESLIEYVEDRKGHDERYAINFSKIFDRLNWSPNESFETGILKTINWYLKNS